MRLLWIACRSFYYSRAVFHSFQQILKLFLKLKFSPGKFPNFFSRMFRDVFSCVFVFSPSTLQMTHIQEISFKSVGVVTSLAFEALFEFLTRFERKFTDPIVLLTRKTSVLVAMTQKTSTGKKAFSEITTQFPQSKIN